MLLLVGDVVAVVVVVGGAEGNSLGLHGGGHSATISHGSPRSTAAALHRRVGGPPRPTEPRNYTASASSSLPAAGPRY